MQKPVQAPMHVLVQKPVQVPMEVAFELVDDERPVVPHFQLASGEDLDSLPFVEADWLPEPPLAPNELEIAPQALLCTGALLDAVVDPGGAAGYGKFPGPLGGSFAVDKTFLVEHLAIWLWVAPTLVLVANMRQLLV